MRKTRLKKAAASAPQDQAPGEALNTKPARREMNAAQVEQHERLLTLLQMAAGGDHAAFDQIAHEVRGVLIAGALRVLNNYQDAEDAAQDALLGIWRDCQAATAFLSEIKSVVGFAHGRAVQCALAMLVRRNALKRGAGRVSSFDEDVKRELFGLYSLRNGHSVVDVEARAGDDPLRRMGMVHRLVTQMPVEYVNKLDAYFFKGESFDKMAAGYGVSVDTVKRSLGTGIQILRHLASKEPEMREEVTA